MDANVWDVRFLSQALGIIGREEGDTVFVAMDSTPHLQYNFLFFSWTRFVHPGRADAAPEHGAFRSLFRARFRGRRLQVQDDSARLLLQWLHKNNVVIC